MTAPPAPTATGRATAAPSRRGGWTLLELALAVFIAALAMSALFAIHQTAATTVARQEHRRAGSVRAARFLDDIGADLSSLFVVEEHETLVPRLETDPRDGAVRLDFCAASRSPGDGEDDDIVVRRIGYRSVRRAGAYEISRFAVPLAGPVPGGQAGATNVLFEAVAEFEVLLFDGEDWVGQWPGEDDQTVPRAARVRLLVDADRPGGGFTTEVFVATSGIVSSMVERASVSSSR